MKSGKDPRKIKVEEMSRDSVLTGFHSGRIYRKKRKEKKRNANHIERANIRDAIGSARNDLEALSEIPKKKLSKKKIYTESSNKKEWILHSKKRKVKAELKTRDNAFEFILEMIKSKSLYSIVAVDFFRYVLRSTEYPKSHKFRSAIERAMKDLKLAKSIEMKWNEFDKKFPGKTNYLYW